MADYGYVYKTTNLINGRIYIGQKKGTINLSYLGSGKLIEKAILKYGKNNFRLEVLAFATTKLMIDGLEMKFIYEYRQVFGKEFLYNILDGGEGANGPRSQETKDKIRKSSIGKKMSDEARKKMSISRKGVSRRPHSEETKKKIGLRHKGRIISEEQKIKLRLANLGRRLSGEHKYKMRLVKIGKKRSEETKNNCRKNYLKHKSDCLCCVCSKIRNKNVSKCA